MTKPTFFLLLAVMISILSADAASAGWRRSRCGCQGNYTYQGNYMMAPAATPAPAAMPAPTPPPEAAPVPTAQANTGYQSFSYEPQPVNNSSPVVSAYRAPMMTQSGWSEFNDILRGDKKVRSMAR